MLLNMFNFVPTIGPLNLRPKSDWVPSGPDLQWAPKSLCGEYANHFLLAPIGLHLLTREENSLSRRQIVTAH